MSAIRKLIQQEKDARNSGDYKKAVRLRNTLKRNGVKFKGTKAVYDDSPQRKWHGNSGGSFRGYNPNGPN